MAFDVDGLITKYALKDDTFKVKFLNETFTFRFPCSFVDLMELGKDSARFRTAAKNRPMPALKAVLPEGESEWAELLISTAFEMERLSVEPKLEAIDVFKLAKAFPFDFAEAVSGFNTEIAKAKNRAENEKIDEQKKDSTATSDGIS